MKIVDGVLLKLGREDVVNGTIRIPKEVTRIDKYAALTVNDCGEFAFLTFEEGSNLEHIDECVFEYSRNLVEVDFSNCQKLEEIGDDAFSTCYNLKTVRLTDCTDLTYVGKGAFRSCQNLRTVDFTGCTNLGVIDREAFSDDEKLEEVRVEDCPSLHYIGDKCFYYCGSLENVSGFDKLESLEYIGERCFEGTGLEKITFPKTKGLVVGEFAFSNSKLRDANFDGCNIIEIGNLAFDDKLKNISFRGANIKSMRDIFQYSVKLDTIDLRDVTGVERLGIDYVVAKEVLVSSRANWDAHVSYDKAFEEGTKVSVCNSKGEVSKQFTIGDGNIYEGVSIGKNHMVRSLESRGVKMDFSVVNELCGDKEARLFLDKKNVKQYEDMKNACVDRVRQGRYLTRFLRTLGYFGFEDPKTGELDEQKVSEHEKYKSLLARKYVESRVKKDIGADVDKDYIDKVISEKTVEVAKTHSLNDLVHSFVMNNIAGREEKGKLFKTLGVTLEDKKNVELAQFIVSNIDEIMQHVGDENERSDIKKLIEEFPKVLDSLKATDNEKKKELTLDDLKTVGKGFGIDDVSNEMTNEDRTK